MDTATPAESAESKLQGFKYFRDSKPLLQRLRPAGAKRTGKLSSR